MKTWATAIAGMLCLALGPGLIGIYGFFVEPLSREFDASVALLNTGPVLLILVPGLVGPMIGRLADRLPIRGLLLTGATLSMAALFALGMAPTLLLVAVFFLCFSLGLTLYGPVVVNGLMVKSYPGQEARALAIAAIGISIASATLPPLVGNLLEFMDWRSTLRSLVVGLLVALWLVILSGVPRGVVGKAQDSETRAGKGIYRSPAFWLIGLGVALGLNVSIVMAVCYPPHFAVRGYSPAEAGWFLAMAGMAGLTGKACLAWFGDAARSHAKWMAVFVLLLQVVGMTLLWLAESTPANIAAVCLLGFGGGVFIPMHPYLNSRYFDAAVIGEVNGAQMPLFLPFGLVGAPLAGYVYDQTGNYDQVLVALAVVLAVAAGLMLKLPRQEG